MMIRLYKCIYSIHADWAKNSVVCGLHAIVTTGSAHHVRTGPSLWDEGMHQTRKFTTVHQTHLKHIEKEHQPRVTSTRGGVGLSAPRSVVEAGGRDPGHGRVTRASDPLPVLCPPMPHLGSGAKGQNLPQSNPGNPHLPRVQCIFVFFMAPLLRPKRHLRAPYLLTKT